LADLDLGLDRPRFREIHLDAQIVRVLDHGALEPHDDAAAPLVEPDLDIGVRPETLPAGRKEPCLQRLDEDGLVHALLARDLSHRFHQLVVHVLDLRFPCQCIHPLRRRSWPRIPSHGSMIKRDFRIAAYGSETVPTSASARTIVSGPAARSSPRNVRRPSRGSWSLT